MTTINLVVYDGLLTPRLVVSSNIGITVNDSNLFIDAQTSFTGATNIGGNSNGFFATSNGNLLLFKNLIPSSFITIATNNSLLSINYLNNNTDVITGATDLGGITGGLFAGISNAVLDFKNLNAFTYIELDNTDSTIRINLNPLFIVSTIVLTQAATIPILSTVVSFPFTFPVVPGMHVSTLSDGGGNFSSRFEASYLVNVTTTNFTVNTRLKATGIGVIDTIVALYPSAVILSSGVPAVAYIDDTLDTLKFARSISTKGTGGWVNQTIDSAVNFPSMAILGDGNPAIAYYDSTNQDLKFARSVAQNGALQWSAVNIDTTGNVGQFCCMSILGDGTPAITYFDSSNTTLKFARNSAVNGFGTWSLSVVDTVGVVSGAYASSLSLLTSGTPGISYYNALTQDLKFAYNSAVDGSGVWTTVIVDSTSDVGSNSALRPLSNNRPGIAYYVAGTQDLKFAVNSQANGAGTWTLSTVESSGSVGATPSLEVMADGTPAIAYTDATNADLRFARNSAVDGSGTWTLVSIDTAGSTGTYASMKLTDNNPGIAYYDDTNARLKYIQSPVQNGFIANNATFVVSWMAKG